MNEARKMRLMMIGGFLGAGKTSAIVQFARWLTTERNLRGAVVTNDQSRGLVDTARVRFSGIEATEITGGCFCCRSDELFRSAETLFERERIDVLLGEPVGSCTDLAATVPSH